jgi:hypothetical protein
MSVSVCFTRPLVGRRAMMCKLFRVPQANLSHDIARLQGKEPRRGRTGERRMSGRMRGVDARHRRRGMRGVVYGRGSCIREPPRGGSSASAARWLRRTRPNAERRRLDTGGRPCTRVIRQGYPSIRRTETETDLRMRGWALDIHPPQPRIQTQTPARFRMAIDAYRPDHPREIKQRRKELLKEN